MTINRTLENGKLIFALGGRLDTTTAGLLQEEVIPALDEAAQIELDFSELIYVSSAGLRVLLIAQKAATAKKVSLTLTNVSAEIMEVLEMTKFSDFLKIVR